MASSLLLLMLPQLATLTGRSLPRSSSRCAMAAMVSQAGSVPSHVAGCASVCGLPHELAARRRAERDSEKSSRERDALRPDNACSTAAHSAAAVAAAAAAAAAALCSRSAPRHYLGSSGVRPAQSEPIRKLVTGVVAE